MQKFANWNRASALASALALLTLTSCVDSGRQITLAPVPGDLRVCFGRFVPAPKPGALSKREVAALIAELKKSELTKSRCGKRLIAWYETQAGVFAGGR